jgi:hypothetical protein
MTETERLLWKLVDRLRDAPPEVLEGVVSRLAAVIDGQTEKPITRLLVGEYSKRLPRMMEMFRDRLRTRPRSMVNPALSGLIGMPSVLHEMRTRWRTEEHLSLHGLRRTAPGRR